MAISNTKALRGIRGVIAKNMINSLQNTAQLTLFAEFDASKLVADKKTFSEPGQKVGFEDLIANKICDVLKRHPLMNSRLDEEQLETFDQVHISFAIATDNGLLAPTLFNADSMSLNELSTSRQELLSRAMQGALTVKEMTQGTITLSNLGITRVDHFTPILNYPQVAIIGLGQIASKPCVLADGSIGARPLMSLSLTIDHRLIDGAPGGQFLTDLCTALESPTAPTIAT